MLFPCVRNLNALDLRSLYNLYTFDICIFLLQALLKSLCSNEMYISMLQVRTALSSPLRREYDGTN